MIAGKFKIGQFVTYAGAPGIGRIVNLHSDSAKVEFFESVAEPSVGETVVTAHDLKVVQLERETRVFFEDEDLVWRAGRIIAFTTDSQGREAYWIRLPNSLQDRVVLAGSIRVRWDKPPRHPLQILLAGGNETPRFRDARQPVRALLLEDRASSASATGISSAGVQMHAHQVAAALKVIRDPIQRYLLADEVGMGKTIEAGFVIRQTLLDNPSRKVGIICPDALVEQWRVELRDKFFIGDFGRCVKVVAHSDLLMWRSLDGVDLLVVDEAHLVARVTSPDEPAYALLARLAHKAARLLLLSATPFGQESTTHLALLHLLDKELFSWERRREFDDLLQARRELAYAVYLLDEEPDPENREYLEYQLEELKEKVPADEMLEERIASVLSTFDTEPVDANVLAGRLAAVRAHVSETYRLHQRVIRNRRHAIQHQRLDEEGVMTPFSFTGRVKPKLARPLSNEVDYTANLVEEWLAACRAHLLDHDLNPRPYGALAGILVSRIGGPIEDVLAVMQYRAGLGGEITSMSAEERQAVELAPLLPFESDLLSSVQQVEHDAVSALSDHIVAASSPSDKVVVFCGQGRFAHDLVRSLQNSIRGRRWVLQHLSPQSDSEREQAVYEWRRRGGVLVADESGDIGRNLQDASLTVHARLPWNPNHLEQRIGRVDRYGRSRSSRGMVVADSNSHGVLTAWAKLLSRGFGVFERSISAEQEAVVSLAENAWDDLVREGVEAFSFREQITSAALGAETRRINELDALESSWEITEELGTLAEDIATYDDRHELIERQFRSLITGAEGFRFEERPWDGSLRFARDDRQDPLLAPRLVGVLQVEEKSRIGDFDRWSVQPGRRLFRRGNPFIDAVEQVLNIDDRGQASALWRIDPSWSEDALVYFAFDILVEADPRPLLKSLDDKDSLVSMAVRRCDWALRPFTRRVWIATHNMAPVESRTELQFLNAPFHEIRDTNLNPTRLVALHNVLGPGNLEPVAKDAATAARRALLETTSLKEACARAAGKVASETEVLLARDKARSSAVGMVADPGSLELEIQIGRAVREGVENPLIREFAVTCLVRSSEAWDEYV